MALLHSQMFPPLSFDKMGRSPPIRICKRRQALRGILALLDAIRSLRFTRSITHQVI